MSEFLNISAKFNAESINILAKSVGLIKRVRKITGADLILSILHSSVESVVSFNVISSKIFMNLGKDISRQRLHKIISSKVFDTFFSSVNNQIWTQRLLPFSSKLKCKFGRILVQDSTILKLPNRLFQEFSGVVNGHVCTTNCRVQVCVDLITNMFHLLSIDSYSVNDIKARNLIQARRGDLVIRDRGYLVVEQLHHFFKKQVYFITRPKSNFIYYSESGKQIDFMKLLSKKKNTILKVRVGSPTAPLYTILAQKVSEDIAAKRRRLCKLSTKGRKPSKQSLFQLSWSIYITNIPGEEITFKEIWELYSLRWRIEIIFKALKSHINLNSIHNVSANQLRILIQARILIVLIIVVFIYHPLQNRVKKTSSQKKISLLKLIGIMSGNIQLMLKYAITLKKEGKRARDTIMTTLTKLSAYETRNRINFSQMLDRIALS